ncbi:MAG: hypothetical protein MK212_17960 [Saprospiraceae bacterium]|nr:hypothetical protein [Saprospiraceae bacterium]
MNSGRIYYLILFVLFLAQSAQAQTDSLQRDTSKVDSIKTAALKEANLKPINNWRAQTFASSTDTFQLDSMSVFPNSIQLRQAKTGSLVPDSLYQIIDNQIVLNKDLQGDSLQIRYRVLPYELRKPLSHKDRRMIGQKVNRERLIGSSYTYSIYENNLEALDFDQITLSGTFARGISLGNRQDLVLNSSLNLQVAGKVGDAEILGSITDNQVPLQPEGNTQQIQDFDQMFIQFKLNPFLLVAGDYDLKRPKNSYFMNYFRRLQGAQLAIQDLEFANGLKTNVDGSFAFSRGNFARNSFDGLEGNQGPYKLSGNNGERFIIIIAGTERVFIDGQLLQRGANADYTIDYNQGEITFTNRQLITKDKRIVVEFTYTDLNYLRTVFSANANVEYKKTRFRFNFFTEQDAKNQPAQETLSDSAKVVLLNIGDNIDQAFVSGASIPEEATGLVAYRMMDTIANGQLYDSVFIFDNTDAGIYNVRFSQISSGGNYIRTLDGTNGTVYKWVAPDSLTGQATGTHEPIVLLITPKKKQLITVGGDYKWNKNAEINADFALSNRDLNTFSPVGNEDNAGVAARLTYKQNIKLRKAQKDSTKGKPVLSLGGHYEFVDKNFEAIDPYRRREFQRDWNQNSASKQAEHLMRASVSLANPKWGRLVYQSSALLRDTAYQGFQNSLDAKLQYKGFELTSFTSYLQTKSSTEQTRFLRPKADIGYRFKKLRGWKIGVYGEQEWNRRLDIEGDSLSPTGLHYNLLRAYSELPVDKGFGFNFSFSRRYDYAPVGREFVNNTVADDIVFSGQWAPKQKKKESGDREKNKRRLTLRSNLDWNFTYRNLRVQDTLLSNQDPKETYLGRLSYRLNFMRNFINWTTTYELGAGQQQKIEYNYVEVDAGQGVYQWIDRNDDGVQQQNEFEQTNFQDQANFIRVTVLTGDFVRSNNVGFNQNLSLNFRSLSQQFKKKGKKQKGLDFLGRFSTQSIFQIDRKTLVSADILVFNPFQLNVADTSLVSVQSRIQNTVFFNRSKPKFSLKFNQIDNRNKTLLVGGFDSRSFQEYSLFQGSTFGRMFRIQNLLAYGKRTNTSEFFPDRNYQVQYYKAVPEFNLTTAKNKFRVTLEYAFNYKKNQINAEELAISHQLTSRVKFTPKKTNLEASFSFVQLNFDGQSNTAVEFIMTDGLQNGQNYLWSLSFNRALSKDGKIQMWLSYEGRKVGDNPVVHVGRAQLRASF